MPFSPSMRPVLHTSQQRYRLEGRGCDTTHRTKQLSNGEGGSFRQLGQGPRGREAASRSRGPGFRLAAAGLGRRGIPRGAGLRSQTRFGVFDPFGLLPCPADVVK